MPGGMALKMRMRVCPALKEYSTYNNKYTNYYVNWRLIFQYTKYNKRGAYWRLSYNPV